MTARIQPFGPTTPSRYTPILERKILAGSSRHTKKPTHPGGTMYNVTDGLIMPTTIIGSLPRPSWFTENLGSETFLRSMMNSRFREQYTDTVAVHLSDQEVSGLDICTDGDAHYDEEVGGQSWTSYPLFHMEGLDRGSPRPTEMSLENW